MRILHCCLAAFYIDNYSYQENILPRMHKLQGHDVAILASTETFIDNTVLGYLKPSSYQTKEGIPVTRLPYTKWLPHKIAKKLRIYEGISEVLNSFKPDIIFLHDCQFIGIVEITSYALRNPKLIIYVDGHTDFSNSARTWVSRNILHRIIYKWCARKINPFVKKFYGTLPARVDFFIDIYGISPEKVELLVMGADLSTIDLNKRDEIRSAIRNSLKIDETDFVIITGGKIDFHKNIPVLMKAVNALKNNNIKLIVFGSPILQLKEEINALSNSKYIRNIGWLASERVYDYFLASDLAFFPGRHSVLWEQAVGVGLPGVFLKWDGHQHIDLDGNCLFINNPDINEIKETITLLFNDNNLFLKMKSVAMTKGLIAFSYFEIAKRAIER